MGPELNLPLPILLSDENARLELVRPRQNVSRRPLIQDLVANPHIRDRSELHELRLTNTSVVRRLRMSPADPANAVSMNAILSNSVAQMQPGASNPDDFINLVAVYLVLLFPADAQVWQRPRVPRWAAAILLGYSLMPETDDEQFARSDLTIREQNMRAMLDRVEQGQGQGQGRGRGGQGQGRGCGG